MLKIAGRNTHSPGIFGSDSIIENFRGTLQLLKNSIYLNRRPEVRQLALTFPAPLVIVLIRIARAVFKINVRMNRLFENNVEPLTLEGGSTG